MKKKIEKKKARKWGRNDLVCVTQQREHDLTTFITKGNYKRIKSLPRQCLINPVVWEEGDSSRRASRGT